MDAHASKKTHQNISTIAVNREGLLKMVIRNPNLSKRDLRVFLHLLTCVDALKYTKVTYKKIAEDLEYSKAEVKDSVNNLFTEGILDINDSESVEKGLMFNF